MGLVLLACCYSTAKLAGNSWLAVLATAYVGSSTLLTHSSQQIKWNAFAQFAALLACYLLLRWQGEASLRLRVTYALAVSALLYFHYFGLWLLPGHLLYVVITMRHRLHGWLKVTVFAVLAVAPWYLYGFLDQLAFVRRHFAGVALYPLGAWNTPIGVASGLRALGYDFLQGLGFLPSPVPGRCFVLMVAIAVWCLARARASPIDGLRRLTILALACAGSGAAAQTLYAIKVGNVVPLQPHYLSPWFPLLMIAVVAGAGTISSIPLRVATLGLVVGLSVATVATTPLVDAIEESDLPGNYGELCRSLGSARGTEKAVVFTSELQAKLVNISCRIERPQAIGADGIPLLPETVRTAVLVASCRRPAILESPGWGAGGWTECAYNTRLVPLTRSAP
jgi:uncharacterized membrane protein